MNNLLASVTGAVAWAAPALALAQGGGMMNGGMGGSGWMGSYGGYWTPILLVIVIVLVAWILLRRGK